MRSQPQAPARIIDSDQHLFEYRGLWEQHIDPALRDEAIRFVDDEVGNVSVRWREHLLVSADVQLPGETDAIGKRRRRERAGLPPERPYDEALPRDYWDPAARAARLVGLGLDEAVLFPNYGLAWERTLNQSLPALLGNMGAWNRWCATVVSEGAGRLHSVAHLSLRDLDWLDAQLAQLEAGGVRLAMIAPALVDGRPLSHPDLDRAWSSFVEHGVTPVFHVADQPRPFDDAWYTDGEERGVPVLESVFLYMAAALSCTDLIVNGVLARHPDLHIGIVELSAVWVPMYLMMLDGGTNFVSRLNGRSPTELELPPSEYFRRQVRVSSFAYELPVNITHQMHGSDILMCCSDYPHSEGTADPLADYAGSGRFATRPDLAPGFFGDNMALLLGHQPA
jgi:predicted TIM-barrel fold metal-dependent hydrolase